jgi:hypothetical protein
MTSHMSFVFFLKKKESCMPTHNPTNTAMTKN